MTRQIIIECNALEKREIGILRCNVCDEENEVKHIRLGTRVGNQTFCNTMRLCKNCGNLLAKELNNDKTNNS